MQQLAAAPTSLGPMRPLQQNLSRVSHAAGFTSCSGRGAAALAVPRVPQARTLAAVAGRREADAPSAALPPRRPGASSALYAGARDTIEPSVSDSNGAGGSGSGGASSGGRETAGGTLRADAEASNAEVYDRLIAAFREREPEEWRKLIAYSQKWPQLADGVLQRLDTRAAAAAAASDERAALRALGRRLRAVHEETASYRSLVGTFRGAHPDEWEALVAGRRRELTSEFFLFLEALAAAAAAAAGEGDEAVAEREELLSLLGRLGALVTAYDSLEADAEAMRGAAQKLQAILDTDSLEQADAKIDALAATGRLDPALLLLMAKAHNSAKDTDITREEVKDIMAHLYFKAREGFAAQAPPEVRILKHLLSLDDPRERTAALDDAFTPGPELATEQVDYLATTPERLMAAIDAVLGAYESQRGQAGMVGQAAALMHPQVIEKMRDLQQQVRKQYM